MDKFEEARAALKRIIQETAPNTYCPDFDKNKCCDTLGKAIDEWQKLEESYISFLKEEISKEGVYIDYHYQKYHIPPECVAIDEEEHTIVVWNVTENDEEEHSFSLHQRGKLWWLCSDLRKEKANEK